MSQAPLTRVDPLESILPARKSGFGCLGWAICIVVIGGMLVSIMLPSLCRAREPANRVKCGSNLRQVGQAIMMYANDHGGQYPPSLAALLSAQDISMEVVICPSSNDEKAAGIDAAAITAEMASAEAKSPGHKPCVSYVYLGKGLTRATAKETTVVAYEPLENHQSAGTSVLFGDGRVEFIEKKEWEKMAGDAGIVVGKGAGG